MSVWISWMFAWELFRNEIWPKNVFVSALGSAEVGCAKLPLLLLLLKNIWKLEPRWKGWGRIFCVKNIQEDGDESNLLSLKKKAYVCFLLLLLLFMYMKIIISCKKEKEGTLLCSVVVVVAYVTWKSPGILLACLCTILLLNVRLSHYFTQAGDWSCLLLNVLIIRTCDCESRSKSVVMASVACCGVANSPAIRPGVCVVVVAFLSRTLGSIAQYLDPHPHMYKYRYNP